MKCKVNKVVHEVKHKQVKRVFYIGGLIYRLSKV